MAPTAIAPATPEDGTAPSPQASAAADAVAPSTWRSAAAAAEAAAPGCIAVETETEPDTGVIYALLADDRVIAGGGVGVGRTVRRDMRGDEVQGDAMKRKDTAMGSLIRMMTVRVIVIETVDGIIQLRMRRREHRSPRKEV